MKDLLNCPLCKNKVQMIYWRYQASEYMQWGQIRCLHCGLMMPTWNDIRTNDRFETVREEASIETWNTRGIK